MGQSNLCLHKTVNKYADIHPCTERDLIVHLGDETFQGYCIGALQYTTISCCYCTDIISLSETVFFFSRFSSAANVVCRDGDVFGTKTLSLNHIFIGTFLIIEILIIFR
jgi:hypothetical protein